MTCPDCQRPNVEDKCRGCGWRAVSSDAATDSGVYTGSYCGFRQGNWQCRHQRWVSQWGREGFVLCEVHAAAGRLGASSLDEMYDVLVSVRADAQRRSSPSSGVWPDGKGGWLYAWEPPADFPNALPPEGRYIKFHWQPIEVCWKALTGHDALPAVATPPVVAHVPEKVSA